MEKALALCDKCENRSIVQNNLKAGDVVIKSYDYCKALDQIVDTREAFNNCDSYVPKIGKNKSIKVSREKIINLMCSKDQEADALIIGFKNE